MSLVKRITIDGTSYDIAPANMDSVPTTDSENPISSGGIKSYLESSYVPLSATQAPVTGLTDILTPVNLLPNSDFKAIDGLDSTRTINQVTTQTAAYAAWSLRGNHATFSNIQLNKGDEGLFLKYTPINSTRTDGAFLLNVISSAVLSYNKTYTLVAKITGLTNIDSISLDSLGSISIIKGFNDSTNNIYTLIFTSNSTSNQSISITLISAADKLNSECSIRINSISLYEGAFENPAITNDLAEKPGLFSLVKSPAGTASYYKNFANGLAANTWIKIFTFYIRTDTINSKLAYEDVEVTGRIINISGYTLPTVQFNVRLTAAQGSPNGLLEAVIINSDQKTIRNIVTAPQISFRTVVETNNTSSNFTPNSFTLEMSFSTAFPAASRIYAYSRSISSNIGGCYAYPEP